MRITWTTPARQDANAIFEYLVERNPKAATTIAKAILNSVRKLADFPHMGRPGRLAGTRELVIPRYPYLVIYGIQANEVVIYHVLHGAQAWPPLEDQSEDEDRE